MGTTAKYSVAVMHDLKINIIILNWNDWEDTINCVNSLQETDYAESFKIIIIDNGSTDNSAELHAGTTRQRCLHHAVLLIQYGSFLLHRFPLWVNDELKLPLMQSGYYVQLLLTGHNKTSSTFLFFYYRMFASVKRY